MEVEGTGFHGKQAGFFGGVLSRHVDAFRRELRGDFFLRGEPTIVKFETGAQAVNPRQYNPTEIKWLASCMAALAGLVLAFYNS